MVMTSCEVTNISRKSPWELVMPAAKVVLNARVGWPGRTAFTTPAAATPPSTCATKMPALLVETQQCNNVNAQEPYLSGLTAPIRNRESVTAGLKRPPLTRKNAQALTANAKPKAREMNSKL